MNYRNISKVITLIFIMVSMLTLFGPVALADVIPSAKLSALIEETNEYIYDEIEKAQEKADKEIAKEKDKIKLEKKLDKIIENLLEKTENKVDKLIKKAAAEGVTIVKEYKPYLIGNRIVMVDPCYAH